MPTHTQAADLGGDCCADLEERVAELEATTVRKDKKLSMTISGQVNAAITHYSFKIDDISTSDTSVLMGPGTSSRVQIDGRAEINKDWEALYRFSFNFDGIGPDDTGLIIRPTENELTTREAYVGIRSKQLGALTLGTRNSVVRSAGKVDVSGKLDTGGNLSAQSQLGILNLIGVAQQDDGDGGAGQFAGLRYDSPSIAGFTLSAEWVNKNAAYDQYGVRLSFGNQIGDFKIAAAAAMWQEDSVLGNTLPFPVPSIPEQSGFVGSAGVMHVPTGIFVNASYGETDHDIVGDNNSKHWAVQAGVQVKTFPMGSTTIYGAYYHSEDNSFQLSLGPVPVASFAEYELEYWQLGVVQEISAANMDVYLNYREYDSKDCQDQLGVNCSLSVIMGGAIIKF